MPFAVLLIERLFKFKFRHDRYIALMLVALTLSQLALVFFWNESIVIGYRHSFVIIIGAFLAGVSLV